MADIVPDPPESLDRVESVEVPDDAPAQAELTPLQVLELLRAGKEVVNARVRKLKLRGEFDQPMVFRRCTLIQAEISAATFKADVAFNGCVLDRLGFNRAATFEKGLSFANSTLSKCTLNRMTVGGNFDCSFAEFKGRLAFADNTFRQKVRFWEARFHCWLDLKGCTFEAEADFRSVHADQGFVLTRCTFKADALFRGASVSKKFQADGSAFEKLLDLSKAKLHDFCYLEGIACGPHMRFAFQNALAERILVAPAQVEGRLASELAGDWPAAMSEYGLLKKCYQGRNQFDHEDWAFYRFKVNQRRTRKTGWAHPWGSVRAACDWLFLDVGSGYGTSPGRAVRMAGAIILAFAALYAWNVQAFYVDKRPFEEFPADHPANRVMIGLITSVSVFTSGMGGIRELAHGWMNVPIMVESVMGTLLFGLFIVAFSRKVIR